MANKRVSELVQITAPQLNPADLFLLSDVSAQQSKKLTLADLNTYILTGGNLTASLFGTASWAQNAITASFAATAGSAQTAITAAFALNGGGSSTQASASWASQSLSSSFATTASFAKNANATSASFATTAQFAGSSSYLVYTGGNNGTAANAILAQTAVNANTASLALTTSFASTANTASYALNSTNAVNAQNATSASFSSYAQTASVGIITTIQDSASFASSSISASFADLAAEALSAITASYVLPNASLQQYGIFLAITQSNYQSQLDFVGIDPFLAGPATTSIEVFGTVVAPYTSSILLNESVTFYVLDRSSGIVYNVDSAPVYVNIQGQFSNIAATIQANVLGQVTGSITGSVSGSAFNSGSLTGSFTGSLSGSVTGSVSTILSGSIKFPFSMMGQLYLNSGSYMLFVSASTSKIYIEPTRTARFSVSSNVGQFLVNAGEPLQLTTTNPADRITFSSSLGGGGPFTDTAAHIVASGSTNCLMMDISLVNDIRYIWTLTNLTTLKSSGNTLVSDVGGMPNSIVSMSLQGGGLAVLRPLSQSVVSYLNFNGNNVVSFPALPPTMSYINCSNNPLVSLPSAVPYGVTQFYAANTNATQPPSSFPTQTVSMSFSGSNNLSLWLTTLPTALTSLDVSNCPQLAALPTIPSPVLYLNVSNGAFTAVAQDNICANLVSNGQNSGSLNLVGNATLLPTTLTRIATLQSRDWTVSY